MSDEQDEVVNVGPNVHIGIDLNNLCRLWDAQREDALKYPDIYEKMLEDTVRMVQDALPQINEHMLRGTGYTLELKPTE